MRKVFIVFVEGGLRHFFTSVLHEPQNVTGANMTTFRMCGVRDTRKSNLKTFVHVFVLLSGSMLIISCWI